MTEFHRNSEKSGNEVVFWISIASSECKAVRSGKIECRSVGDVRRRAAQSAMAWLVDEGVCQWIAVGIGRR